MHTFSVRGQDFFFKITKYDIFRNIIIFMLILCVSFFFVLLLEVILYFVLADTVASGTSTMIIHGTFFRILDFNIIVLMQIF